MKKYCGAIYGPQYFFNIYVVRPTVQAGASVFVLLSSQLQPVLSQGHAKMLFKLGVEIVVLFYPHLFQDIRK